MFMFVSAALRCADCVEICVYGFVCCSFFDVSKDEMSKLSEPPSSYLPPPDGGPPMKEKRACKILCLFISTLRICVSALK